MQWGTTRKALFRSYGCFFAEFLGEPSLVRLTLLELTTCVGLRYGLHNIMLREFSWKRALLHSMHLTKLRCSKSKLKNQSAKLQRPAKRDKSWLELWFARANHPTIFHFETYILHFKHLGFVRCTVFAPLGVLIKERFRDLPRNHPYGTNQNPIIGATYCTPSTHRMLYKSWNINHVSIACGFRHSLRPD